MVSVEESTAHIVIRNKKLRGGFAHAETNGSRATFTKVAQCQLSAKAFLAEWPDAKPAPRIDPNDPTLLCLGVVGNLVKVLPKECRCLSLLLVLLLMELSRLTVHHYRSDQCC